LSRDKSSDRSTEPQALGSVLDALGAERRLATGLLLGRLGRHWEAVVGERLAEESAPAALEGGVLFVRATSAGWAAQIKFLAKEIRAAANRVLAHGGRPVRAPAGAEEEDLKEPIREVKVVVEAGPMTR
jgi:predicted nucleic acid-binding Zn ribbon protein